MTTGPHEPLAPVAPPTDGDGDIRTTGWVSLALGCFSCLVPLAMWALMPDRISGDDAGGLLLLALLCAGAALGGFVAGIVARHEGPGALGILVSMVGGLISSGSVLILGLGAALSGVSNGL